MLATLTISGSGAASTQTACGRRVRAIRSVTIACSRRSLSLRRSCSPRWSSTAGSELRRVEPASATVETLAPERRSSSSGLAPMNAASGVPQQKQKQEENCSPHRAEEGGRVMGGAGADQDLARQHDLRHLPRSDPLGRGRDRPLEIARRTGAADLGAARSGAGRAAAAGRGAGRKDERRGCRALRPGSSPGLTTALRLRKVSAPLRQIESCGSTSDAGASDDQGEVAPPSGSKAKPPTQTAPAPAGSPRGSSSDRVADAKAFTGDVAESLRPSRGGLAGDAERCKRKLAIRLLPAEPAVRRQPRCENGGAGIDSLHRHRDADNRSSLACGRTLDALAQTGEEILSRHHGRSRSLPCGPSQSGRGGGSSARRPRSCRRSRSPRSSSSAARRRRSWRGRSRRTG